MTNDEWIEMIFNLQKMKTDFIQALILREGVRGPTTPSASAPLPNP